MALKRRLPNANFKSFPFRLLLEMSGADGWPCGRIGSVATFQQAIDQGITILAIFVGCAIHSRRQIQLTVKFGALRGADGLWLGFDSRYRNQEILM